MNATAQNASVQHQDTARPAAPTRYLGRQPIVDENCHLYGYELLFRAETENAFSEDPEQATQQVVDHWMLLMPEPDGTCAFVNCTRATLMEGLVTMLPPAHTVLEILENVYPDPALIKSCQALKQQGYRFALDDFFPDPRRAAFVEFADFVKIDFRTSSAAMRREIAAMLTGSWAMRLAEKIETEEEMRVARAEGCLLFQGYFFSRPVLVASPTLPQNRLVYLRLLAALHDVPADIRTVESLVMSDATLCYRVLRLANSALQGHAGVVSSVREALLMVGDDAVRRMVTVALAGVLSGHRPPPLVSMALARARFCELLAPAVGQPPQQHYLLGMLSLLDALLEMPMSRILKSLPLNCEMKGALMGDGGPLAPPLDLICSLEACDWHACETIGATLGLTEPAVAAMYVEALRWAANSLRGEG
ncbi:MAG TPA: HDOD domain-containing protein [Acidobacteriaceae bacterium]|jgi:EAL and modified HD-GYP domain-containing signal transduction protein|nr:HDOD domain-containing protein [Acidobacteriaceae bacterium]